MLHFPLPSASQCRWQDVVLYHCRDLLIWWWPWTRMRTQRRTKATQLPILCGPRQSKLHICKAILNPVFLYMLTLYRFYSQGERHSVRRTSLVNCQGPWLCQEQPPCSLWIHHEGRQVQCRPSFLSPKQLEKKPELIFPNTVLFSRSNVSEKK